ncbi:MAG: hypothetical protein PWQ67_2412 [Clostridia bacterium]|jgi:hypothetical protein|nr:hypothetical protein [Clostridia bacterium]
MTSVTEKAFNFNKMIKVNFDGGDLSSDSGLLLIKEFDNKIGFSQLIKDVVKVNDPVNHTQHKNEEVILQKIYQSIAGYHADDHADELKIDPVFTVVLGKERLASQPTISRLNKKLDENTLEQLQKVNSIMLDRVYKIEPRQHVIFDLDSTNFATYGNQSGACYNSHYQANGYHPLFLFDGLTGDCIKAELRPGNVYTSNNVKDFIEPVLEKYDRDYPWVTTCIRGDSGFAVPNLYEIAEQYGVKYVIRLKANAILYKYAEELEILLGQKCKNNAIDYQAVYGEFDYQASSWHKPRRVVVKIEKPAGEITFKHTFIVTNIDLSPKDIVKFYSNRGTMENFIKEGKNGFAFDNMSSNEFLVNANKLQQLVLAYNLNNWFRRLCLPEKMKASRIETIRLKLFKIAGKIINTGRYIKFKLSSSYLYQKNFWQILTNIERLPKFI